MTGIDVRAIGTHFRVAFDDSLDPDQRQHLQRVWSCASAPIMGEPEVTVTAGIDREIGDHSVSADRLHDLSDQLADTISKHAVKRARGELLLFRGFAVATETGRAVIVITDLDKQEDVLAALVHRFTLVARGVVGVTADFEVLPHRMPRFVESLMAVPDQTPDATLTPTLAAIVLLQQQAGEGSAQPTPLTTSLPDIVSRTLHLGDLPEPLHTLATVAGITGGIRTVTYESLGEVADAISWVAEASAPPAEQWRGYAAPVAGGFAQWGDITDAIDVGGTPLVMRDNVVHALGGVGPVIWELIGAGASLDELVARAVEAYGEPPAGADVSILVTQAVDVLVTAGLATRA